MSAPRAHLAHFNLKTWKPNSRLKRLPPFLSCGWGSGAIYYAEKLPNSRITAFSNSKAQKEFIDAAARAKGLTNVSVITARTATAVLFTRIFSV